MTNLIYLISFIEALAGGLLSINLALYLKYTLKVNEITAGTILSVYGIVGGILIFLLGTLVDKYGIKLCMLLGSTILIMGRLGLGLTASLPIALSMLLLIAIGGSIKSSSVLVYLKQYNKSFSFDYLSFNMAFCLAGLWFDSLKGNYQLVYLLAAGVNAINLLIIVFLPYVFNKNTQIKTLSVNRKVLSKVLLYNAIMLPIASLFTWYAVGFPKWMIEVLGKDSPVGSLYGSLNPFIILFTVPLASYFKNKYKINTFHFALFGTVLSALAMFIPAIHYFYNANWYIYLVISIIMFTVGEAIWSPSNMEIGAIICPKNEEGKYLTLSNIPRILGGFVVNWIITASLLFFVYSDVPRYELPFICVGLFALITPLGLTLLKKYSKILKDVL